MTGRAAEPSLDTGAWAALSRRFSRYLDLALGIAAAVFSVVSLLSTDVAAIDPRLEAADAVSVVATVIAGISLVWRRTRPVTAFVVFVSGCLVVSLTGHYTGLLSVLLLFALYSPAAHGSRRAGVTGLATSIVVFIGLALLDVPDLRTSDLLQACALLLAAWALGDAIRSRRAEQTARLWSARQEAVTAREQAARLRPGRPGALVDVSAGLSNQEIADHLHMGYGTVKTHVSHLLAKLDCRDRAQLVMRAYESGVAVPGRG